MAVVVLTAGAGAPGVTTTALMLTRSWGQSVILVDADYRQSVLAGYLRGELPAAESLMNVVNAARVSQQLGEVILNQAIPLAGMDQAPHERLFIPGLATAQMTQSLAAAWTTIAPNLRDLAKRDYDIIIDAGRLTPLGLSSALIDVADLILIMVDPVLAHVGASRWAVDQLADAAAEGGKRDKVQLLLMQAKHHDQSDSERLQRRPLPTRYSRSEVSSWLSNASVAGEIGWDPENARVMSHGVAPGKRFARSRLASTSRALAEKLRRQVHRGDDVLTPPDLSVLQFAREGDQ